MGAINNKKLSFLLSAIVTLAIITGVYALFKAPALKPDPVPPPAAKQPIPGVKTFDAAKYPHEPQISVYMADTGTIQTMALETYLEGVIAQEIEPDWPEEALAAQAVTSRTLTLYALEEGYVKRLRGAD
ncbi:MAG: SpoIID/LytB domain-containing protein, partial [Sporomusaceae bacterium]|nr:SpoIID/LytB domain-containing protein [Sporomusaceae bacterium]